MAERMIERKRQIEEIAYLLWEHEGRPDGQAERFWHEAEVQYETEQALTRQDEKEVGPPDEGDAETAAAEAADVAADAAVIEAEAPAAAEAFEPEAP